ncbi:hypothetical protein [Clostridium sp. JN-1]|jgi:hypothetical protein|uniref:hypothetical protein n=1 Tax=Clostridium sp. JN-1 TaxID=2483110 RepID=UPI000F0B9B2F|nr:hypothetical protein [Clostridium sp. JN-1]
MINNYNLEISEDVKRQMDSLISKSNVSTNDFIKLLAKSYHVDLTKKETPLDLAYGDYWNSFID